MRAPARRSQPSARCGRSAIPARLRSMDPDLLLLQGLCERRASALEDVFRRHGERVHRLCLSILGSAPDAEDATQEIFLKLFERAASFSGRARFTTWLHRVTVNHCLNAIERERTRA